MPGPGLLFGFLLLAGMIGGVCAKRIKVPKVVGYLVAGIGVKLLLGWYLQGQDSQLDVEHLISTLVEPLRPINDLALGLILFSLGTVFETSHIKSVGGRILKISLGETGLTFLAVFAGCSLLAYLSMDIGLQMSLTLGILLGTIAVATAPAATLFVLQEYDAKGPTSDTLLSLVGLNNIFSIIMFHVLFLVLVTIQVIHAPYITEGRNLLLDLILTTVGSALLGLVLGMVFSVLHAKLPLTEMLVIFLATLIGLGEGCEYLSQHYHLSFNFLLTSLFLGAAFCNLAIDPDKLYVSIRTLGLPIFAGFFAIAGYELHLAELRNLGLVGIGYVVLRSAGKYWGALWGVRHVQAEKGIRPALGAGLLCQAGVAIGLVTFLKSQWGVIGEGGFVPHVLATTIATIVMGSVAIFEAFGPLTTKWVVVKAGEVKALALLSRIRPIAAEGQSVTWLIFGSLMRMLGLSRTVDDEATDELRVKHIMRTNVKFLSASANLDEVLHFVERSRFNTFPTVDDDGNLVGIIMFSDIRDIIYDPASRILITAADLADPTLPIAHVDQSLEELLGVFAKFEGGALPVTKTSDSRIVVGIVEQRDLLRALHATAPSKSGH